jgi:hypothetical protein
VGRHGLWIALFTLPSIVLWWHVWSGNPSTTLTCACGDPAQEVWFIAWPAWALAHFDNPFFSGAVNVPYGANLLSNTSGTLIGSVLSPVTWLWGPVVATNVALTLAPGLSAWGGWLAIRRLVTWKPGAVPAALVFGYSSAVVTSLIFAHVSVTLLVVPPLLFATLHEIVIRQAGTPLQDGVVLGALVVTQFLISPEVLVMCALLAAVGMVAVLIVGWRRIPARLAHAGRALVVGLGISVVLLAYPAWFGLFGPQSVTGVLFAIAPLSGVVISGYLSPGAYGTFANAYVRFGGYYGRVGPPPNYVGWGIGVGTVVAAFLARRRPIVWLFLLMTIVSIWLSLGSYLISGPRVLNDLWLPWHYLGNYPLLEEILPDQFAPLATLFIAFLLAIGLDAFHLRVKSATSWQHARVALVSGLVTAAVGVAVLVPVFLTFDMPLTVRPTRIPVWISHDASRLPPRTVLLTVPFPISGSDSPMLWQAADDMHFLLAGAALKTPNPTGGPEAQGAPGSARHLLADLTMVGNSEPSGTVAQLTAVRDAVRRWGVDDVVIDGQSRDPIYASGFLTAALGTAPQFVHYAWVWKIPHGGPTAPVVTGASLADCRGASAGSTASHHPLAMATCVLRGGTSP